MVDQSVAMSTRRMWLAGFVMALSNFMVVLDTAIANVAVPHIAGSLAISPDQGTWVITSYAVAEAICVPLTGWLALRFGTVRCYILCMTGFAFFSFLCGTSVTLGMLVSCRIGQGIAGGPIMALTQTLLLRVFPPRLRGAAMGLWAMTAVAAPVAGPLLGGTISDTWSWHWVFLINLPVAAFCVTGAIFLLRPIETPTRREPVDAIGLALLITWVGALQIMLDIGRDHDWFGSTEIWILAIVAGVGFLFFLVWELTAEHPVVDLRVFRHRGFTVAAFSMAFIYAFFFAAIVVTPQWLQGFLGYTATWAGYVIAWQGAFAVVSAPLIGRLLNKVDPRAMVSTGVLWLAFSMWLRWNWTPDAGYWTFALPHLLNGFGMPAFFVPITMLAMSSVLPAETASAAGLQNFLRTLSGAVGTAVATTLWIDHEQSARASLVDTARPPAGWFDQLAAMGFNADQARAMLSNMVEQQAVALATVHLFQITTVVLVFSAALIWLVPKPKRIASSEGAH